jgi:NAD(P)-dependent dehydrogenase (short-subunit alcohol dehydrogenase family)
MSDDFDLTGKVALITGGSRGLGRQMAMAFAKRGAKVAIASRKLEQCEETAAEIAAAGGEAFPIACHVADWDRCGEVVEAVHEHFGRIDVLVNNAGMSPLYPSLAEVSEALFDKVIGVNLKGPFRLSALVGRHMAEGDGGSIINISSIASIHPSPNAEPYGAAKAGLNRLTESFAWEYGPKVRVNAILAGPFLTDISEAWDMDAFEQRAASTIPLKRGGQPNEIVGAALYFASNASSFTTGALLRVDGGSL